MFDPTFKIRSSNLDAAEHEQNSHKPADTLAVSVKDDDVALARMNEEKSVTEQYQERLSRIEEAQRQIDAISNPEHKKKAQEVLDGAVAAGGSISDAKKDIAAIEGNQITAQVAEGTMKAAAIAAAFGGFAMLGDVVRDSGKAMRDAGVSMTVASMPAGALFTHEVFAGQKIAYGMSAIDRGQGMSLGGRSLS
jgi:hypothetical protein